MKYLSFEIENYRAIIEPIEISLKNNSLIPLIGINECGKTTILQAICCFDYFNDNVNALAGEPYGPHLQETKNLYSTTEGTPFIKAKIGISYDELSEIYLDYLKLKNIDSESNPLPIKQHEFNGIIEIQRNLLDKKYVLSNIGLSGNIDTSEFSKEIVKSAPYILYNDDFNDRPPSDVDFPQKRPDSLTLWHEIYERLFEITNPDWPLYKLIQETDDRRRNSVIADVELKLNTTLTNAWKTFSLEDNKENLTFKLNLNRVGEISKLSVRIIETIDGNKQRDFRVVDRSKGFLWFFNFIMKVQFNPKITGEQKDTIYLLDEPGSYLHGLAQDKLCKKLKEISDNEGNVIFCTHSHHLLSPDYIPLNKMYIVEKKDGKQIRVTTLPNYKTTQEKTTALQPVFEALQIPFFDYIPSKLPVIVVEGIYDFYVLDLFTSLKSNHTILPGTSADSLVKLIPLLIAFGKTYNVLWDNDDEGKKNREKAIKFFGENESKFFFLLPTLKNNKTRMEDFIDKTDLNQIKNKLNLPASATYDSVIAFLHKYPQKNEIINSVSEATKSNFKKIEDLVNNGMSPVVNEPEMANAY